MYLGCQQREYFITRGIDLNLDDRGQVDVTDSAIDYNGTPLAYHLTGTYDAASTSLSAQINWTFTGSTSVRRDTFTANLASGDTGDVAMTQVLRTGCEAQIRLVRRQ